MSARMETDDHATQFNSIDIRFYTVFYFHSSDRNAPHSCNVKRAAHIDEIFMESSTSFERQIKAFPLR